MGVSAKGRRGNNRLEGSRFGVCLTTSRYWYSARLTWKRESRRLPRITQCELSPAASLIRLPRDR
jgi:hypothetical protein